MVLFWTFFLATNQLCIKEFQAEKSYFSNNTTAEMA